MKGGVRNNPHGDGFIAIVHMWDNVECRGEPKEWRFPEVFPTDEEAMRYYKTSIQPRLEEMMAEMAKSRDAAKVLRKKWFSDICRER